MAIQWTKTKPGIRYRVHPTRKHGMGQDRYWTIFYKLDGKTVSEALGWSSQGMSERKALGILAELKENQRRGTGPRSLAEKKELQGQEFRALKEKGLTVSEFWDTDYLHNLKTRIKPSSAVKEIQHFDKRIRPEIGNNPLINITSVDVEKIRDKMLADGFAPRSVQYMLGTVYRLWKQAAKRKFVKAGDNPAMGVSVREVNNSRLRVLTAEELDSILTGLNAKSKKDYEITFFCAYTGCRFSEAASLKVEHVDLTRKTVLFPETKNRESRQIYLSDTVVKMLEKHSLKEPGTYVFLMESGQPYVEPPRRFKTVVDALGLNEGRGPRDRISFHSLRHTAATLAARRGTTVKDLQAIFGWKTPSMVFRYAKGDQKTQKQAMDGIAISLTPNDEPAKVIPMWKVNE
jgi:integrase